MPDNISVVEATEADLPAAVRLLEELTGSMSDTEGLDVAAVPGNLRALLGSSDSYLLVARYGDDIAGFINFTVRRTVLHAGLSGLIDELIVTEAHRGRGIGRSLVLAAAERCRRLGCCELEVGTEKTNGDAREFYKGCGFREDAVLLEMPL
jgi:GNAT superfamily N-acetyltransferase